MAVHMCLAVGSVPNVYVVWHAGVSVAFWWETCLSHKVQHDVVPKSRACVSMLV